MQTDHHTIQKYVLLSILVYVTPYSIISPDWHNSSLLMDLHFIQCSSASRQCQKAKKMSWWSCLFGFRLGFSFFFLNFSHFGILSDCFTVPWIKLNYIVWMSLAREECQHQRLQWRWSNKIRTTRTTDKWSYLKQLLCWMASAGHFGYLFSYKNETGREMRTHREQNLFDLVHKHFEDQLQME